MTVDLIFKPKESYYSDDNKKNFKWGFLKKHGSLANHPREAALLTSCHQMASTSTDHHVEGSLSGAMQQEKLAVAKEKHVFSF